MNDAEALRHTDLVEQTDTGIHHEDGVGNALCVGAKVADEDGQRAAADGEDDLAGLGDGRSAVVGRHEDSAEEETAGEEIPCHPDEAVIALREEEGEHGDRADEDERDAHGDDLAADALSIGIALSAAITPALSLSKVKYTSLAYLLIRLACLGVCAVPNDATALLNPA